MELITDIDPIAYSDLYPPMFCLVCKEYCDSFVAHSYRYNGFQVNLQTCNKPTCIANICEQVAKHITNDTFNMERFHGEVL